MRESELLFPSTVGGFRTTNVFKKVFDDVCRVMGLKKKISARAMRRTFQDLAREANIDKFVQRSICGHSTEEMSQLYSTVGQKEIERAVGKVISMAGYRRLTLSGSQGDALGMHGENGSSERQPEEAIGEPTGRLTN
jgi:integrase